MLKGLSDGLVECDTRKSERWLRKVNSEFQKLSGDFGKVIGDFGMGYKLHSTANSA